MKTNFVKLAKDMLAADEAVHLARRYLSVRRRQRILKVHIRHLNPDRLPWEILKGHLESDAERAVRRIPECSNRLVILRRWLEEQMLQACTKARFSAVIAKETTMETLALIPKSMDRMALVIAYSKKGLLIDGKLIPTAWGKGCGLAVIHRTDLARVLAAAEYGICIVAFDDHWEGWIDCTPSGVPKNLPKNAKPTHLSFTYYADAETEA
ncbi:MAG: hypothetical protein ACM359_12870 [Bacillota bacterium]